MLLVYIHFRGLCRSRNLGKFGLVQSTDTNEYIDDNKNVIHTGIQGLPRPGVSVHHSVAWRSDFRILDVEYDS